MPAPLKLRAILANIHNYVCSITDLIRRVMTPPVDEKNNYMCYVMRCRQIPGETFLIVQICNNFTPHN